MKKRYSIGFFAAAMILILAISSAYQISFERAKERAKEEARLAEHEIEEAPTVTTEGEALKEDCYYLFEVNGYVVVYLSDKKTAYEYTSIEVTDLPYTLQNEIKNGKYVEDTETLYGFLENYSS